MATAASRPFIAAMQVTLDGYSLGPDGTADWVDSWADGLKLLPRVDAFVLGGNMFPDYEVFWAAIREDPEAVAEWLGRDPYPREIEYARVAAETPHLVLSKPSTGPPGRPRGSFATSTNSGRSRRSPAAPSTSSVVPAWSGA